MKKVCENFGATAGKIYCGAGIDDFGIGIGARNDNENPTQD